MLALDQMNFMDFMDFMNFKIYNSCLAADPTVINRSFNIVFPSAVSLLTLLTFISAVLFVLIFDDIVEV